MKKIIVLIVAAAINLTASVDVSQNFKALYKNVDLSESQQNYIIENQEKNEDIVKDTLNKKIYKLTNTNQKSVISMTLQPNGEVKDFKFLSRSDSLKIDNEIKKAIIMAAKKFSRPKEETEIRYIIKIEDRKNIPVYHSTNSNSTYSSAKVYQNIQRGTTRFPYSSKVYTRVFTVSKDGFLNLYQDPTTCAKNITILEESGRKFAEASVVFQKVNKEIRKGSYKILILTKQDCSVNLDYP